jgi:hypothetical protein
MAVEDYLEAEVGVAVAATAALFSPRVRKFLRRGAVLVVAGTLMAGDAVVGFARGVARGTQKAAAAASAGAKEAAASTANGARGTSPKTPQGGQGAAATAKQEAQHIAEEAKAGAKKATGGKP